MHAPVYQNALPLLIGPTASGKSAVALRLARQWGAELLSVDSMKLYRGLEIGVAKPSAEERAAVPHHLVDIREPWESCSVAEWLKLAESAIESARLRGVPVLAEGGTALYIKALREGLFEGPGRDDALRARLEAQADAQGLAPLYARLQAADPKAAAKILPGDRRRMIRALEVLELTGQPISAHQSQWGTLRADLKVRVVCIAPERKALYARIDTRIAKMLKAGWLDECRALLALPKPLSREATQALGYKTLFAHLRGETTLAEAQARICFDTHHFARKQLGWYRRFPEATWIEVRGDETLDALTARVAQAFAEPHTK